MPFKKYYDFRAKIQKNSHARKPRQVQKSLNIGFITIFYILKIMLLLFRNIKGRKCTLVCEKMLFVAKVMSILV